MQLEIFMQIIRFSKEIQATWRFETVWALKLIGASFQSEDEQVDEARCPSMTLPQLITSEIHMLKFPHARY